MPLTPADVHNVAFSKPPIGKRGYNEDEVDAFLDLVENELTRLIEENADLRQRVAELDQEVADLPGPAEAPSRPRSSRSTAHPNRSRFARARARLRGAAAAAGWLLRGRGAAPQGRQGAQPGAGHGGPADRHRQGRVRQAAGRRARSGRRHGQRGQADRRDHVADARQRADAMLADAADPVRDAVASGPGEGRRAAGRRRTQALRDHGHHQPAAHRAGRPARDNCARSSANTAPGSRPTWNRSSKSSASEDRPHRLTRPPTMTSGAFNQFNRGNN